MLSSRMALPSGVLSKVVQAWEVKPDVVEELLKKGKMQWLKAVRKKGPGSGSADAFEGQYTVTLSLPQHLDWVRFKGIVNDQGGLEPVCQVAWVASEAGLLGTGSLEENDYIVVCTHNTHKREWSPSELVSKWDTKVMVRAEPITLT
jgi:hypothetical protein